MADRVYLCLAHMSGNEMKYIQEELLARVENPQEYNDKVIYPDKVRINRYYLHNYSFLKDMQMIVCTVLGRKMMYGGELI